MRGHKQRSIDEFIRLACTADPEESVKPPRRVTIAPQLAIGAGVLLLILAVMLAARTAWHARSAPSAAVNPSSSTAEHTHSAAPLVPPVADPLATVQSDTGTTIVVHVAGAVTHPGVVELPAGARVIDAVTAAGGAKSQADTSAVNLARILTDGEQIYLPKPQEATPHYVASGDDGRAQSVSSAGLVNLNTADASTLESLPGIGPALAARIVDYRQTHGPFATVEDITDVSGIGNTTLAKFREQATV